MLAHRRWCVRVCARQRIGGRVPNYVAEHSVQQRAMLPMAYLLAHSLRRVFGVAPTMIVCRGRGATRRRSFRARRRRRVHREVDGHSRGTERGAAIALANHLRRHDHVDRVLRGFLDSLPTNQARNGRQTSTGGGRACAVSDLQVALQTISWSPTVLLSKSRKSIPNCGKSFVDSIERLLNVPVCLCSTSLSVCQHTVCLRRATSPASRAPLPSPTGIKVRSRANTS